MRFSDLLPKLPSIPVPSIIKKELKHINTIAEGIVLPHGLQSKAARKTHIGHMHNSHTGMIVIDGVLTYFTAGIYSAIVGAAAAKYKDRQKSKLTDKQAVTDATTQAQLDAKDAEANRLIAEQQRLSKGGAINMKFPLYGDEAKSTTVGDIPGLATTNLNTKTG